MMSDQKPFRMIVLIAAALAGCSSATPRFYSQEGTWNVKLAPGK
jgi:hypothetical protein